MALILWAWQWREERERLASAWADNQLPDELYAALRADAQVNVRAIDSGVPVRATKVTTEKPPLAVKETQTARLKPALGSVMVDTKADRERIAAELTALTDMPKDTFSMCFLPRHLLRIQTAERIWDLVICFECHRMDLWVDDRPTGSFRIGEGSGVLDELLNAPTVVRERGR